MSWISARQPALLQVTNARGKLARDARTPVPNTEAHIEQFLNLLKLHVPDPGMRAWATQYVPNQAARIHSDVKLVLSLSPNSVLNIGGAPFFFEYLLQQLAPHVRIVSVDLAPERLGGLAEALSLNVLSKDIERETVTTERFDAVVFNEIIEHCRHDLIATIRRIGGLANHNGYIFLATPNGRSLHNLKRNLLGRTGPSIVTEWSKLHDIGHMGHVREYSRKELEELFAHCGLHVCQAIYRPRRGNRSIRLATRIAHLIESVLPPVRYNLAFVLQRRTADAAIPKRTTIG